MAQGKIKVESENIFPIIKKFLYSDHEIFLRELVSNAVDASLKMRALSKMGEYKGELGDLQVSVSIDKEAGTLTITDKGIGLSEAEAKKYLNQVAFSGAQEFLEQYEGKTEDTGIIGNFGLGFYSAFMVAKEVEVKSKSHTDEPSIVWSCDGSPNYKIVKGKKEERGTDIVLHLDEDSKEFLEDSRIGGILDKYCKFLPVPIKFGTKQESYDDPSGDKDENGNVKQLQRTVDNIINNPEPAWTKKPADLSGEDYNNFYRELYPMTFEEPLFHIHLNVDYPFKLTGILYFPKLQNNIQIQRNKIQLYSNQVFITDSVENIVPEFLTLLHGVIDSPDIPLNVSRSYLQEDGNVKKISAHITKKVADKLAGMFKKDREDFENKWDDIKVFLEYGMLTDEKFFDRIQKSFLFKNTQAKYATIEEYKENIAENQTNKDGDTVILYTNDAVGQHSFIEKANTKGYDVIVMDSPLTSHLIQNLEIKIEKVKFARVDADTLEKLIEKSDRPEVTLTEDQQKELTETVETVVDKSKYTVQFESLDETTEPFVITRPEFMRRMMEQQEVGGGSPFGMGGNFEMYNLTVNENHPLVSKILVETDTDKKVSLTKQGIDLAMLSQNMLKGEDLSSFVKRSLDLIQ